MKKTLIVAVLAMLAAAPAAAQSCTLEQVQQKVALFSQKYQDMAQKDPQRLQRFAPKAQEATQKYQEIASKGGTNYDAICKLYDDLLAELDKS